MNFYTIILTLILNLCCVNWTTVVAQVIISNDSRSDKVINIKSSATSSLPKDTILDITKDSIITIDTTQTIMFGVPVSKDTLEDDIKYTAQDSIVFDVTNGKVYLYNKSNIEYGEMTLQGHDITMDWNTKELHAQSGKDSIGAPLDIPKFTQGEDFFEANTITYNFETKQGIIAEVQTEQGEGYLYSEKVRRNSKNELYGFHSYYTTCNADVPHFKIHTQKVKVVPDKIMVSGPANLEIESIKTPLWIPFAIFPIKKGRRSGIIMPTYGDSYDRGFFLRNGGYYFAINDKMDLQLKGDLYSRGSYGLVSILSYASRYKHNGSLSVSFARNRFGDPSGESFTRQRDFFVRWNHMQNALARPGTNFSATLNAGTSNYYRNNSYIANDYLTNQFSSSVSYSKRWLGKPFQLNIAARHSQSTRTHLVSMTLPEVIFSIDRQEPFKKKESLKAPNILEKIGINYTLATRNEYSRPDSLFFNEDAFSKFRNGIHQEIPINTSTKIFKFFTLSAGFNYNENWYTQTIRKSWGMLADTTSTGETMGVVIDTVREFRSNRFFRTNLSLSTRIYGVLQFKKGKLKALRHVMTPSISYSFHPNFNYNLNATYLNVYQKDKYGRKGVYSIFDQSLYGGPPIGQSSTLTFNLDNNLEAKVFTAKDSTTSTKKLKILDRFSISSSYNFAIDTLQLGYIHLSANTSLFDKFDIISNTTLDAYMLDTLNERVNKFVYNEKGRLARFVNSSLTLSTRLNAKTKKLSPTDQKYISNKYDPDELQYYQMNNRNVIDYNMPWQLSLYYTANFRKTYNTISQRDSLGINQLININADVSITKKWKLAINTGYDFTDKNFTYTSLDLYRDLHCWEMRFGLIPFGPRQSFNFTINVKAQILQDLKITRRRDWWEYR